MPNTTDRLRLFVLAGLALVVGWAFLPTLTWMSDKWADDPQYSHGFLVPLFAGYLLWRKGTANLLGGTPSALVAGAFLVVALGVRWLGGKLLFYQLDALALLLTLLGVAAAVGGWKLVRGAAPAVAFLVFMVPLPYEMERNVGGPLKVIATEASTYFLQTLGYPAVAEGNRILIDEHVLGVEDACSGLKMLVTFSAFGAGAVLLLDRTLFEKLMIALGVVPIAVFTNVVRVTVTGVTYTLTTDPDARHFTHDLYVWLMMPMGLGLLALQLWCLNRMVIRPATADAGPLAPAGMVRLSPAY
jgi:exosortase